MRTLSVDQELSPLVRRRFEVMRSSLEEEDSTGHDTLSKKDKTVLKTFYRATTNRMLRVAVNGFFESMGVVLQVMEELDMDVINEKGLESLERVQGVEQGMTGETVSVG